MFKAIIKSLNYPNALTLAAVPYTQFMVHSKQELNQLTGKLRNLSKAVLPYFTILLLEEVTTPASLEALYSYFHFAQPDGSRAKRWWKDWSVFAHLLLKLLISGRATVVNAVQNEVSLARLKFFNCMASIFEPFLKLYLTVLQCYLTQMVIFWS